MNNPTKHGILLLNLGGPETLKDVKPFLYRLFSDPDILVGIPTPIRQMIAFAISQGKGPSSIKNYALIGGGSPQLKWTRIQAQGLEKLLNDAGIEAKIAIGMRASPPFIRDSLRELKEWGADHVTLFPLFPQYSTTTTGSCFKEARRVMKHLGWNAPVKEIRHWPDHADYAKLLRKTVDEAIIAAGPGPLHILFSAHSLPMKIVERGDPYPQDVQRTIEAVTSGLTTPWTLAFQSRNGKMPWIQPYTEDELRRLGGAGTKRLVVVPVSFVSDHIETLQELDVEYAHVAKEAGIEQYTRSRSFNDDPEFQRVLFHVYQQSV